MPASWVQTLCRSVLAACVLALGMLASPARAAEPLPAQIVCYDDVYVPFFMTVEGKFTGLDVDVLQEAARRVGIKLEFGLMPWRRIESELARSRESGVACAFGFSRTDKREQFLEFGKVSLNTTEYTLFVRNETPGIVKLDELEGKTIGVRAGFRLPDIIASGVALKRWRVAEVSTDTVNFQKLALGRVDAVLADRSIGLYTLRQLNLRGLRIVSPALMRFDTYLVFAKSSFSPALAAAFDRAFLSMLQDGTMERLHAPYLGPMERER